MRHILVIEDSPLVLKILEHLFRQEHELQPVFCASLAEVMLETSTGLSFAAIVDLHLPDAPNGENVDLVMRYRLPCIVLGGSYNEQRRDELIIIGLSADAKGSLSAMFIKHGADDFPRKPFCPEELNCRVMSTLERRDLMRALKQAAQFDALTGLNNRRASTNRARSSSSRRGALATTSAWR